MSKQNETTWSWFYSAPIEEAAVRRGDPLGMRKIAEDYAEVIAPGLSNRTLDARWFTILSWCLRHGYQAWQVYGDEAGQDLASTKSTQSLYRWIRPLELLWIAKTYASDSNDRGRGRQLPGIRTIESWCKEKRGKHFGFSTASYERYRFTGPYGAYRVGFRSLPGMTRNGDGWQLGEVGEKLADIAEKKLPKKMPAYLRKKGRRPNPENYWLELKHFELGWKDLEFLPTPLVKADALPHYEAKLLRNVLFGDPNAAKGTVADARRRRSVAELAASCDSLELGEVCQTIANGLNGKGPELESLSAFCFLSEAGVAVMNEVWGAMKDSQDGSNVATVLDKQPVQDAMDLLSDAAKRWRQESKGFKQQMDVPTALAEAVLGSKKNKKELLNALVRHHKEHGGGLRWVALQKERLVPLAPLHGSRAGNYQFRLHALSRMAVQCRVIPKMPGVFSETVSDEAANS